MFFIFCFDLSHGFLVHKGVGMRVFFNLLVLFSIVGTFSEASQAAAPKQLIEYRSVTSAIVSGKKCTAREISKLDLSEFVKAWKSAKYKGTDKYKKGDLTLTIVLDNGGVRVFQIKDKKIQESGNGDTWSLKKNLSSLCS